MFKTVKKMLKSEQGFTLIELMVVVIIIGILAAVAIPQFANQTDKAKKASVESDLRNWGTAIELYHMENNAWPGETGELYNLYDKLGDYADDNLPLQDPWNKDYRYVKPNDDDDKSLPKGNLYDPTGISGIETIYWKD